MAVCYQFTMKFTAELLLKRLRVLGAVPTLHGSFFQLRMDSVDRFRMILGDGGNWDQRIQNMRFRSAMMKLVEKVSGFGL